MSRVKPVQLAFNVFEPALSVKNDSPIIFLHGLTASKEHWNEIPQIAANATNRRAYSLDCRNHGDSEWSDEFSFDINVVDLLHFMDQIKAERAILVGHSMGGITSMKTALQYPSKVEKMVVEDMTVRKLPPDILGLIKLYLSSAQIAVQAIPPGMSMENAKTFIGDFVYNCLPDEVKPMVKRQKDDPRILLKQNQDGSFSFKTNIKSLANALSNDVYREYVGNYNGPVCFIYGKESVFSVGQDEELLKKYFPAAQLVGIEGASHSVHTDCPYPFMETLLRFLKE